MDKWTDDEIIGAILAGGHVRPIMAHADYGAGFDNRFDDEPVGPVCAVAAGVLFAGLERSKDPIRMFMKKFGVSRTVACGISCGFEDYHWHDTWRGPDYARGWAIGAAVRSAIEEES